MKRILIMIENQLLATSINNLLLSIEGFSVHCASFCNMQELLNDLTIYHPDVLILDDSDTTQEISKIFMTDKKCLDMRVIIANQDNNHLKIYERFEFQLSKSADFIDAIGWDFCSPLRESKV